MFDIYFPDTMQQKVEETKTVDDESLVFDFDLDFSKSIGESDDYPIIVRKYPDGCICKKCGENYPYAEPNQKDGSMVCYSCRKYG